MIVVFICEAGPEEYHLEERIMVWNYVPQRGDYVELPHWKMGYRVEDRHWSCPTTSHGDIIRSQQIVTLYLTPD